MIKAQNLARDCLTLEIHEVRQSAAQPRRIPEVHGVSSSEPECVRRLSKRELVERRRILTSDCCRRAVT